MIQKYNMNGQEYRIFIAINIATNILEKGEEYTNKYIEMLKQGCSQKSIELLKMVNVDLENKDTYKTTVNYYKDKMKILKEIIKK